MASHGFKVQVPSIHSKAGLFGVQLAKLRDRPISGDLRNVTILSGLLEGFLLMQPAKPWLGGHPVWPLLVSLVILRLTALAKFHTDA